jgi:hypothetical protein
LLAHVPDCPCGPCSTCRPAEYKAPAQIPAAGTTVAPSHDGKVPLPRSAVPLPALLKHMELFYSDWHIANDLDCVLACCADEFAVEAVKRYARARRKAYGFSPKSLDSNSHRLIAAAKLAKLTGSTASDVHCVVCGRTFSAKRSTARFCTTSCRVKGNRRGVLR